MHQRYVTAFVCVRVLDTRCIFKGYGRLHLYVSANHMGWIISLFRNDDPPEDPRAPKTPGRLVFEATSFGSIHTTAERRARWGGDAVPEGFIRLSVGCEDIQDLLADLTQALALC